MSRIGDLPIEIPEKVEVAVNDQTIKITGPLGELERTFKAGIDIKVDDNEIVVERNGDDIESRSMHGLVRSLIEGMVEGVSKGFEKKLEMVGVGYNAQVQGDKLKLEVGYSHPVIIEAEGDISFEVEKNTNITVKGIDKQRVGDTAAKIREVRKPEPYKGKGIKYVGEHIRRKVGKTG
ncbi:LSU ribosomal protein L6p (L9e) [Halanaerobium saccharolyticum subsp. saccharolyticum DSM 6643]|uniref:Large ribosomal subunit protein uL6 n=1 Tax=Halanaerobium saccharolyticum subsp. saccharolyticum DSM 6643 TaxID=1293054 RepID=M5EAB0_9FIRM|nr:50S ribosomal protein L6 [Halanaerobium saccharolyticum]CCU77677.1 LSU ribosomal protein L6p (L9e) [Halanaerobium saccharolyticum subsp. saccharolyticum DSM 6643]